MEKQFTALELADLLDAAPYASACTNASAEKLRRLHAINAQLLEALGEIEWSNNSAWQADRARAAIAAARRNT